MFSVTMWDELSPFTQWLLSNSAIALGDGFLFNFVWFYGALHLCTLGWFAGIFWKSQKPRTYGQPSVPMNLRMMTMVILAISFFLGSYAWTKYAGMFAGVFLFLFAAAVVFALGTRCWQWVRYGT